MNETFCFRTPTHRGLAERHSATTSGPGGGFLSAPLSTRRGKRENDLGPPPEALGLDPYPAIVDLDDSFHQRESDAAAVDTGIEPVE